MAKKVLHIISPVTDLIFNQLICEANPDGKKNQFQTPTKVFEIVKMCDFTLNYLNNAQ